MSRSLSRTVSVVALAVVFTAGLTFATVELPALVDRFLERAVPTPGWDSHADDVARLKTSLFIAHYHLRTVGYAAFFALVGLVIAGFATRRSGLAALGAFGMMLPVFAQFAGVMFFLAGLGLLNVVWFPLLDLSFEIQHWGRVIDLPNDLLRWLLGLAGVSSPWPTTVFFIASGILVFLSGVFAWLAARARGRGVAEAWIYRFSRHPQYLGWILWTYGAYLLQQQMRYPRRSWGISGSLPWLLSTMVVVAVALAEELAMRRRHGEAYQAYRRGAPFLLPVPRVMAKAVAAPFHLLFGKWEPARTREIVVVVGLYTLALVGASWFLHAGGVGGVVARFASAETRAARLRGLVTEIRAAPGYRQQNRLLNELVSYGDAAVGPLLGMLEGGGAAFQVLAAEGLERLKAGAAVPALAAAVASTDENLRYRATEALGAIGARDAVPALVPLLDDPVIHIRVRAMQHLAALGEPRVLDRAPELLADSREWVRVGSAAALGALGSEDAVPALVAVLGDASPQVRREAVVALLRTNSSRAKPALERMLADGDWETRVYASEALERLPDAAS